MGVADSILGTLNLNTIVFDVFLLYKVLFFNKIYKECLDGEIWHIFSIYIKTIENIVLITISAKH
jgi:hypothetical protein